LPIDTSTILQQE